MAHLHFLTTSQEAFLRLVLVDAMRHFSREIDSNVTLYTSFDDDDDLKSVVDCMLHDDRERISIAKELYRKFSRR